MQHSKQETQPQNTSARKTSRKTYRKPVLCEFGTIVDMTQSGYYAIGTEDSVYYASVQGL